MTQQRAEQTGVYEVPGHHWQEADRVAEYVERTTSRAEERRPLFEFMCDLFPFEPDAAIRVLDIGAGYGAVAEVVLERFPNAVAVGLDISEPMMEEGRKRMARFGSRFSYHYGDMAEGDLPDDLRGPFDAAVASASIHHLPAEAKVRLYAQVFGILRPGGCFFNVDSVAPATPDLEAWARERRERDRQRRGESQGPLAPNPHALLLHHHWETEAAQIAFLRSVGFVRVDCFYKRLRQTVIGGFKPS